MAELSETARSQTIRDTYAHHRSPQKYVSDSSRGIERAKIVKGGVVDVKEGYRDCLPRYQDEDIITLLNNQENRAQCSRILDVGCGDGCFLYKASLRWPHIRYYGLTACTYPPQYPHDGIDHLFIRIGDIHDLPIPFEDNMFSLVVSVHAMQYLVDPIQALHGIYRCVQQGGIVLLHNVPIPFTTQTEREDYLYYLQRNYNFEVENRNPVSTLHHANLSFRKEQPRLNIPASPTHVDYKSIQPRILYRFEKQHYT